MIIQIKLSSDKWLKLTLWQMASTLQNVHHVSGFMFTDWLEPFSVCDAQVRPHIISTIPQLDLQVLVSKDFLFLAEDGIRELWLERRNRAQARLRRRHEADIERIVGVLKPYPAD